MTPVPRLDYSKTPSGYGEIHKGRLGTVRVGAIPGEPTIEIDPYGPHVGALYVRTPRPATFAEWV